MNHVLQVPVNERGRDFFTTDIHGCFDLLVEEMRQHAFSPASGDRLFSSGDWCDRGAQSDQVLEWLNEPWIYSTRANHEQMLIDAYENPNDKHTYEFFYFNGGAWFYDLKPEQQKVIYESFKSLPLAIELLTPTEKIGIIHAQVPRGCWNQFKAMSPQELDWEGYSQAQWARTKYDKSDKGVISGVDFVLSGHTPTKSGEVEQLGNQLYCDLGSFFRGKISFIEVYPNFIGKTVGGVRE